MKATYLIVSYNPPEEIFKQQLTAVYDDPVIIVDNGSKEDVINTLNAWVDERPDKRHLITLGKNLGIAAALNKGIVRAQSLAYQLVLLLDHDSIPSAGLLTQLRETAGKQLQQDTHFAALGARLVDPRSGKEVGFSSMQTGVWRTHRCAQQEKLLKCEFLNSSGSLIYIPAWEKIGIFDESFFIDHVETDWYMRARALGYHVYGSCQGVLHHYLGDSIVNFWFFGWRTMPHRSGPRHYTIVRNSLWMYRRHYVPFSWKVNNICKLLFTLVFFSLFDKQRGNQFTCILRGFYDGLFETPSK